MLTVVRWSWDTVDDGRWRLVRRLLSTEQLAPYGCLSSHLRRSGTALRVNALWDDEHGARIFCAGRLRELVARAGLDDPGSSRVPLPGTYATGRRPVATVDLAEVAHRADCAHCADRDRPDAVVPRKAA